MISHTHTHTHIYIYIYIYIIYIYIYIYIYIGIKAWSKSVMQAKPLYIHYSGLPRDRALSWWSSTLKVVLKRAFTGNTGEASAYLLLRSPGWQSFWVSETRKPLCCLCSGQVSGALLRRWCWKGCSLVTLGKTTCSLFRPPGEQSFELVEFFLEDGFGKTIHQWYKGSFYTNIQVYW